MKNKLEDAAREYAEIRGNIDKETQSYIEYNSFKDGAQWQLENMWIPVEEELPLVETPVFVLTANGNASISKMYFPTDCTGHVLGDKEWNGSYHFKKSIIAWMYKPKFKKGE